MWPDLVFGLAAPHLAKQAADGAAQCLHAPLEYTCLLLNTHTVAYTIQPIVAGLLDGLQDALQEAG